MHTHKISGEEALSYQSYAPINVMPPPMLDGGGNMWGFFNICPTPGPWGVGHLHMHKNECSGEFKREGLDCEVQWRGGDYSLKMSPGVGQ